jgi:hypothetical protein
MVKIEFVHVAEGRVSEQMGPHPFVQLTYGSVRVGEEGEQFVADYVQPEGLWRTEDGQFWTDFTVVPA